jgi:hypothetical protein
MTEPEYEWSCEECGEVQYREPAEKQSYAGGIELWFCDDCVVTPYF